MDVKEALRVLVIRLNEVIKDEYYNDKIINQCLYAIREYLERSSND